MFCCRELLFSKLIYWHQQQQPPPPVVRAAVGDRISRQSTNAVFLCCFFAVFLAHTFFSTISDDTFVGFFGVVLELARPSEPWCFAAGSCFFRSYCTGISSSSRHLRAAAGDRFSRKKVFFQDFRRHVRQFFSVVLKLARPLEPWFFAAGSCRQVLFSKLVSCEQLQATESLDKCCFSIGFQTTG